MEAPANGGLHLSPGKEVTYEHCWLVWAKPAGAQQCGKYEMKEGKGSGFPILLEGGAVGKFFWQVWGGFYQKTEKCLSSL